MTIEKKHRVPLMSRRFKCRHKTNFFDVFENVYGDNYLKVTQSIREKFYTRTTKFFRETIHINEEALQEFLIHIKDSAHMIVERSKTKPTINFERIDKDE
jgi:hypothetical protein